MWSLGCLTTALLNNGDSVFVNTQDSNFRHDSAVAITRAAAKCDLSLLDHSPAWKDVQAQAKEFVKGLLQLKENARMSAEQALEHAWFTEGPRKAFFEGKYREAIRGWKRTITSADFIENLNILIDLKVSSLSQSVFSSNRQPGHGSHLRRTREREAEGSSDASSRKANTAYFFSC